MAIVAQMLFDVFDAASKKHNMVVTLQIRKKANMGRKFPNYAWKMAGT